VTSILSAISGQFSKSLLLGTFMPVVLFVILNLLFVLPYAPADPQVFQEITDVNTRAVLAITFVTVVLTGLLYNLNIPIIRFYEGYTWQYSKVGQWRTRRYQQELLSTLSLRPRVQDLQGPLTRRARVAQIQLQKTMMEQNQTLASIRNQLGQSLNKEFPISVGSVLPTKLGNVIRSFENYPQRQYNMAGITLYPRLVAVIDKGYMEQIDNAKSSLDFMINCSLLSLVVAMSLLVVGLLFPIVLSAPQLLIYWLVKIFLFLFLSWAFYASSIGRASEWGDLVKGAFDLYRWKLLEQLGFKHRPGSMEEERVLWGSISGQLIYGDRPKTAVLLDYVRSSTAARGEPAPVKLETARGLDLGAHENMLTVTLRVKNIDPLERTARSVILTDTLPPGWEYVWDSAAFFTSDRAQLSSAQGVEVRPAPVTGTNPYRFEVGNLIYEQQALLVYQALLPKQ
jgi:hypothetical protein